MIQQKKDSAGDLNDRQEQKRENCANGKKGKKVEDKKEADLRNIITCKIWILNVKRSRFLLVSG